MKNEEQILELLAETLQRIDRHSEQFDRHSELIQLMVNKLQEHDKRLDQHEEALNVLRERTEEMHQTSLEQVKAYQAITELVMHHNRILTAKGIL